jgi:type IV pilus assembly protein PilP
MMQRESKIGYLARLIPVFVAGALVGACGNDMSDLDAYIAEVQKRPAQPIPPIPAVRTYSPYQYQGLTGRDPFRPSTSEGLDEQPSGGKGSGPRPDLERPREFLERFELDTLAMVGTFAQEDDFWGLVRDPDGVIHRVTVDQYMGKNHGRITRIATNEVVLSELITDGAGGWIEREAAMALEGT